MAERTIYKGTKPVVESRSRLHILDTSHSEKSNSLLESLRIREIFNAFQKLATNSRHRLKLIPSLLDIALRSLVVFGAGKHRPTELSEGNKVLIRKDTAPQLQQIITSDGHVPRWNIDTAIGVFGLTPYVVANRLYQALVDVTRALQCILGRGCFD